MTREEFVKKWLPQTGKWFLEDVACLLATHRLDVLNEAYDISLEHECSSFRCDCQGQIKALIVTAMEKR